MHVRNHHHGNGCRSNFMRLGLAASRVSSEDSIRGHGGFYNYEHRGYNRGFGRGHGRLKNYKPRQSGAQEENIFVEAGKLAAEYLVSQGLLPQSVLLGKWQNGSFRVEGDNLHFSPKDQSRLGNVVTDAGGSNSGRSYVGDNSSGSRSNIEGRRRAGSFRGNGTDWGGEDGRSVARVKRSMGSPDMKLDDDKVSTYREEVKGVKDVGVGMQMSSSTESALKSEYVGNSESKLEKNNLQDDVDSKASSSSAGKNISFHEMDAEGKKISDDLKTLSEETEEVKDGTNNNERENPSADVELPAPQCAVESDPLSKSSIDLLSMCKFVMVPTKIRSSLTSKVSKAETVPNTEEACTSDNGNLEVSDVLVQDGPLSGPLVNVPSNVDAKCLDGEVVKASILQSEVDAGELGSGNNVEQGKCVISQSFPDRMFMIDNGKITNQGGGFGSLTSMIEEKGKKRVIEDNDLGEGTKKPREWTLSITGKADDDYFQFSDLSKTIMNSQEEGALLGENVTMAIDQESLVYNSSFAWDEPCSEYAQEKQFDPYSFKICDLNLMEALDVNENHNNDPILFYPSIAETKKEAAPTDANLLMSNLCLSDEQGNRSTDVKDIEIINLDDDFPEESRAVNDSERKEEAVLIDMDGFSNQPQDAGVNTDVENYNDAFTISDFLGACQNSSPVPDDLNPPQNGMGKHNDQGTVGDDDSIYMSLGEIPLSMPDI